MKSNCKPMLRAFCCTPLMLIAAGLSLFSPALLYAQDTAQSQDSFFGQDTVNKDLFGNEVKHRNRPKQAAQMTTPRSKLEYLRQRQITKQQQKKPVRDERRYTLAPEIGRTSEEFTSVLPTPSQTPLPVAAVRQAASTADREETVRDESLNDVAGLKKRLETISEATQGRELPLNYYENVIQNIEKATSGAGGVPVRKPGSFTF